MAVGMILTEQRNLTRRELIYYLKVTDSQTGRELGRIGDIHGEGMLVMGRPALEVGATYHALMELPKTVQYRGRTEVGVTFQVMWSRRKNPNYEESGVKFLDLSPDAAETIEHLIETFAMPSSAR